MAYTTAIGSIVYRHQRRQIRQPALQNTVRERNLKVRTPCFVPPGHVVPTAFSGMTHSCTQNSVKTATGVFDFGLKCHFSGPLFPKSANNRHSSMILYIPSAILGRNPGRQTIFLPFIRAAGEKSRMRNDFSAFHPDCRGEITDKRRVFYLPSGLPGRNHGQGTIFLPSIRAAGEIFRTGCSNYTLCRYFRAKVTEVYRKTW